MFYKEGKARGPDPFIKGKHSMKKKHTCQIYLILSLIVLSFCCLKFTERSYAMTIDNKTNTNTRQNSYHEPIIPVTFIAWKGDKLMTTAGTFILDRSVEVIDKAGSRYLGNEFKGSPPSVQLFFKKRILIKVIIK